MARVRKRIHSLKHGIGLAKGFTRKARLGEQLNRAKSQLLALTLSRE
jgi:hypothetical protein